MISLRKNRERKGMRKKAVPKLSLVTDFLIYGGILLHITMLIPSPVGSGGQDIGIYLAFILIAATRKTDYRDIFFNRLSAVYLTYMLFLSLSTLLALELSEALVILTRGISRSTALFFVIQILCKSRLRRDNIFALSLFPFFLAYLSATAYLPPLFGVDYGFEGLKSLGLWHNRTALYLNIVLPVSVLNFTLLKNKALKITLGLFILLGAAAVPLTLSRGGIISFVLLAVMLTAGFSFTGPGALKRYRAAAYILLGAAVISGILFFPRIIHRFETTEWDTFTGRSDTIWPAAIDAFRRRPFLGYGVQRLYNVTDIINPHTHNIFLQALFEGGVAGTLIYILMLILFLKRAFTQVRAEKSTFYGLSFICVFFAVLLLHGMIEVVRLRSLAFFLSSIWFYDAYQNLKKPGSGGSPKPLPQGN